MHAMVLHDAPGRLVWEEVPTPEPGPGQLRIRVHACGVCRTDLHIVDGELRAPSYPLIPGHEIVGVIDALGEGVEGWQIGERVGVPWLAHTCNTCRYCRRGQENLCEQAQFTGFHVNGGFAEWTVADAAYVYRLPDALGDDVHVAPLLCAGLIGYRTLRLAGEADRVGLYGFGAAAHILAQILVAQGKEVYAFTRPGDAAGQAFARRLGAVWAGGSDQMPPAPLDAALLFAPVGDLVPTALRAVDRGGRVVSGGIHMSDIPAFPYRILWEERSLQSVANLTREDGHALFSLLEHVQVTTEVTPFALADANTALDRVRRGEIEGAAVLTVS